MTPLPILRHNQLDKWSLIKHFTIVIYDSRVILTKNCPYYDPRVVIYPHKMVIRLATEGLSRKLPNAYKSCH